MLIDTRNLAREADRLVAPGHIEHPWPGVCFFPHGDEEGLIDVDPIPCCVHGNVEYWELGPLPLHHEVQKHLCARYCQWVAQFIPLVHDAAAVEIDSAQQRRAGTLLPVVVVEVGEQLMEAIPSMAIMDEGDDAVVVTSHAAGSTR